MPISIAAKNNIADGIGQVDPNLVALIWAPVPIESNVRSMIELDNDATLARTNRMFSNGVPFAMG